MTNYTKGKWEAKKNTLGEWYIWVNNVPIAQVDRHYNAHLIASAPAMHKALKEADRVICELCKRLNPQHASRNDYEGCEWCQDREERLQVLSLVEGKE